MQGFLFCLFCFVLVYLFYSQIDLYAGECVEFLISIYFLLPPSSAGQLAHDIVFYHVINLQLPLLMIMQLRAAEWETYRRVNHIARLSAGSSETKYSGRMNFQERKWSRTACKHCSSCLDFILQSINATH